MKFGVTTWLMSHYLTDFQTPNCGRKKRLMGISTVISKFLSTVFWQFQGWLLKIECPIPIFKFIAAFTSLNFLFFFSKILLNSQKIGCRWNAFRRQQNIYYSVNSHCQYMYLPCIQLLWNSIIWPWVHLVKCAVRRKQSSPNFYSVVYSSY